VGEISGYESAWSEVTAAVLDSAGTNYHKSLGEFIGEMTVDSQRAVLDRKDMAKSIIEAHVECIFKYEQNDKLLSYMLASLDGILYDDATLSVHIINLMKGRKDRNVIQKLMKFLPSKAASGDMAQAKHNTVTIDAACRILSVILSNQDHYHEFLVDCRLVISSLSNMRGQNDSQSCTVSDLVVVVSFSNLLLVPEMTKYFFLEGGHNRLKDILHAHPCNLQIMYYSFLTLWVLSFDEESQDRFSDPTWQVIPGVVNALRSISREKLSRIAFKLFKNISQWDKCIELMNDSDLMKVVESEQKKNLKDEQLKENLETLFNDLEMNYRIASSWEKYVKELETGTLKRGPCHSERFWKSNAKKFEHNEFQYIKTLIHLLYSNDSQTQAVACYDLGEFCRFSPYSRVILNQIGNEKSGKSKLMEMIKSDNAEVREEALLATQKMMIHNWQNLKL